MRRFCCQNFSSINFSGSGNTEEITKYVGNVDVERDESGNTALMWAAVTGNEQN